MPGAVGADMVGIDVGVSQVTFSNGEIAQNGQNVPRDLLVRVAKDLPYVSVCQDVFDVRPSHEIYAAAVAAALSGRPAEDREELRAALAVPGWWTPRTVDRVRNALTAMDVDAVLINDAEAAVAEYQHAAHPLPGHVAVLSLRSNQVGVVIVRNDADGPSALASPVLIHEAGGHDLDMAVLQHVVRGLNELGDPVAAGDPQVIDAAKHALEECRGLREALSISATESVLLDMPNVTRRIRVVRSELEEIAAPWADAIIRIVSSALELCSQQIDAVLLTGGLADMPLISQRLSADLGLEVYVPEDPNLIVVRGAERLLHARTAPAAHPEPSADPFPEADRTLERHARPPSLWKRLRKHKDAPSRTETRNTERRNTERRNIETQNTATGSTAKGSSATSITAKGSTKKRNAQQGKEVVPGAAASHRDTAIETLLDVRPESGTADGVDTSWIPRSPASASLARRQ